VRADLGLQLVDHAPPAERTPEEPKPHRGVSQSIGLAYGQLQCVLQTCCWPPYALSRRLRYTRGNQSWFPSRRARAQGKILMRRAVWRVAWRVVAISLFLASAIAGISGWLALPLMLIVAMLDAYESEDPFPFT
jgi:hypothetical protein